MFRRAMVARWRSADTMKCPLANDDDDEVGAVEPLRTAGRTRDDGSLLIHGRSGGKQVRNVKRSAKKSPMQLASPIAAISIE
jgi:hypothetical protein